MDPVRNPFAPGAGAPPPELAGRDALLDSVKVALQRVRRGSPAKSVLMVGLRGVGKTVLLDRMRKQAGLLGLETIQVEAPEDRSLPALLAPDCGSRCCGCRTMSVRETVRHVRFGRWPGSPAGSK
jgi:hypothetical protein